MDERRFIRGIRWSGLAWLSAVCIWGAGRGAALDTLVVGTGELAWPQIERETSHLVVGGDSVWTWRAEPGENLALGSAARVGGIRANVNYTGGVFWQELPGLDGWVDGDPETAWGPDEDDRVERQVEVELDLGAFFGIDRIRFHPRLDREHQSLLPGDFEVRADGRRLFGFSSFFPNRESVVDVRFERVEARRIRLVARERDPWEIAELEVYGDGTAPPGVFTPDPLFIRGGYPLWGRVWTDRGEVADLPIQLQTRTGTDAEPEFYFLQRGDDLEKVSREVYRSTGAQPQYGTIEVEQGPIEPNPAWSPWETVSDGVVLSPGPRRYMQFRLVLAEPGTAVGQLFFEYASRPLAEGLPAEISPLVVEAGEETEFTLSLEVHVDRVRGDTGFRYIQVLTPAAVQQVVRVLVDDREAVYTATYQEGEGFTVDLWERLLQSGSFAQIVFRAAVLRDGTSFQVRALDLRPTEDGVESVYQIFREGDVEPLSVGGELVVRLQSAREPLVQAATSGRRALFTPNGDGINDRFAFAYNLLKLTRPVSVSFAIFALDGRLVRQGHKGAAGSGQFVRLWDGRDDMGNRVPPGLYLFRVRAETDSGPASWQGMVDVAY